MSAWVVFRKKLGMLSYRFNKDDIVKVIQKMKAKKRFRMVAAGRLKWVLFTDGKSLLDSKAAAALLKATDCEFR